MLVLDHWLTLSFTVFYCFIHYSLKYCVSCFELESVIKDFITSLDYCNPLFICHNKASLEHLHLVKNAAAALLTRSSDHSRVTW